MSTPTILVGGFSHETNTFAEPTDRADFRALHEYVGAEIPETLRGTNTQLGGAMEYAEAEGIDLVYSLFAGAVPGGPVTEDAFEHYAGQLVESVREHEAEIDGIKLALHGAMVAEHADDGEGELIRRIREVVGESMPIAVSLDLHGNLSDEFLDVTDVVVAFDTYPHVDMGAAGSTATRLLAETIAGDLDPTLGIERPPLLPLGPTQNTRTGAMVEVMAAARDLETRPGVEKVNVFPGFHQADIPFMGMSICVVTDGDDELATAVARELAAEVWDDRSNFVGDYPDPADAIATAKERAAELDDDDGFVLLADIGDNPGGGGSADTTGVLRELLDQNVENAGFALVADPESVAAAVDAGVGERVTLDLGGKTNPEFGEPIRDLDGYVKAITDGEYVNTGPMATGSENNLGRGVLLQCGANDSLHVVVSEHRIQPLDAEIWRHLGIQPERLDVMVVKSSNHYRADYEPMCSVNIPINSPGLVAMDPRKFEFTRIRRPKFPLDEMTGDEYPDWE